MEPGEAFTQDFLEHYGVKGMKWGVRRSRAERRAAAKGEKLEFKRITPKPSGGKQQEMRRITPKPGSRAAKKAANNLEPSADKQEFRRISAKVGTKGNTKALSNDDLRRLNDRLRLEQEFSRLSGEGQPSKGKKMVKEILTNAGKQQASRVVNQAATQQVDKAMRNRNK